MTRSANPSPGNPHGPNRFDNYKDVHDRVMEGFRQGGFVSSEDLRFTQVSKDCIAITGVIKCQGGIRLSVDKKLKILSGNGPKAVVQTAEYHYNAYVEGEGNLLRYDSPHQAHPDTPDRPHRPFHHVHRYKAYRPTRIDVLDYPNDVPTLGDVLDELRDIYYEEDL